MTASSPEVFLPLFILQMPQKALSRFELTQDDWAEFLGALLDMDIGANDLATSVVSLDEFCDVFRLAIDRFGRDGMLRAWIEDIRARHMGPVGLAMEAAPTLDDSLNIWRDNADLLAPTLLMEERYTAARRYSVMSLAPGFSDIAEPYLELVVLLTAALIRNLSGGTVQADIRFAHDAPMPEEFYRSLGFTPRFGEPVTSLGFALADTTRVNDYYAPLMYQQALAGIAELRENIRNHARLGHRVRQYLEWQAEEGTYPHLEEAAARFAMSMRTFARHLREEGLSYRELRTEVQIGMASRLLRKSRLPVKTIADRAGFTNISAFSRAFAQATGQSPQEFRRADGESPDSDEP
jgi:AraC-like DNA-binding protein